MANISDIAEIAEAMAEYPVYIVADRCVAVRNRNATCRECIAACPFDVFTIGKNEIAFDADACVGCGACTAACPTEALLPLQPDDEAFAGQLSDAVAAAGGAAVFGCARIASKHVADPDKFVTVPCLARIDEGILVQLAARGVMRMTLVDGTCSTCKYGATSDSVDAAVACANELLEAHGSAARAQRASAFPPELVVEGADSLYGSTRRGFFTEAAGNVKNSTLKAVKATLDKELHLDKKKDRKIGERLRVSKSGALPLVHPERHGRVLDALDSIGAPVRPTVYTRLFATVDIDVDACNACGMCAVFCPTGAIRRDDSDKPGDPVRYLEFSACDCVQCGMCMDVCWKKCLTLSDEVPTDELFDFEPRTFDLSAKVPKGKKPAFPNLNPR